MILSLSLYSMSDTQQVLSITAYNKICVHAYTLWVLCPLKITRFDNYGALPPPTQTPAHPPTHTYIGLQALISPFGWVWAVLPLGEYEPWDIVPGNQPVLTHLAFHYSEPQSQLITLWATNRMEQEWPLGKWNGIWNHRTMLWERKVLE